MWLYKLPHAHQLAACRPLSLYGHGVPMHLFSRSLPDKLSSAPQANSFGWHVHCLHHHPTFWVLLPLLSLPLQSLHLSLSSSVVSISNFTLCGQVEGRLTCSASLNSVSVVASCFCKVSLLACSSSCCLLCFTASASRATAALCSCSSYHCLLHSIPLCKQHSALSDSLLQISIQLSAARAARHQPSGALEPDTNIFYPLLLAAFWQHPHYKPDASELHNHKDTI